MTAGRDRYQYTLAPEVRVALEREQERTDAPFQAIIDRAVRKELKLPPKKKAKKRGA